MTKPISKEDRYFIDCLREVLGYDPLYEDLSEEERKEQRKEYCKLKAKTYAELTPEEKKKRLEYQRRWRQRQKEKAALQEPIKRKMPGSERLRVSLEVS